MRAQGSIGRWAWRGWALIGVAALVAACGTSPPASPASPAATRSSLASPAATAASAKPAAAIPDGRYVGPELRVADIVARLSADATLDDGERQAVIDDILRIRGADRWQTVFHVKGAQLTIGQRVDDGPVELGAPWPLTVVDATTIKVTTPCCGVQTWRIRPAAGGFTMAALAPPSGTVHAFVRHLIFESGPFVPEG